MDDKLMSASGGQRPKPAGKIGGTALCLLLLASIFLLCGSCEKDQITGLDLTNNYYLATFRYVLSISGNDATLSCPLGEIPGLLTINGRTFGDEYWWPSSQTAHHVYYEIPNIYGGEYVYRDTTDYTLIANGASYSGRIIRPGIPVMNMPEFDLGEDYSFSWTADPQPLYFRLNLYFLDEHPDRCIQLDGRKRSYTVDRAPWVGASWYIFNVLLESINYNDHGKDLLVIQSSGSVQNWVQPPE